MDWIKPLSQQPRSLGILAGAFHPPTCAHLALARAALRQVDDVLFVLPRELPHKRYEDVTYGERRELVSLAIADEPRFSAASSEGGLFIEIAAECHRVLGEEVDLYFLCGRDAAERIVNWDYGRPGAFPEMLDQFGLLVAPRQGRYEPPAEMRDRILPLDFAEEWNDVSATEIRRRIRTGEPWETFVPIPIVEKVRELYS